MQQPLHPKTKLASCTINNEPGVVIVMIDEVGEGKIAVMPLFVAITPGMKIDFPGERELDGGGEGGPSDEKESRSEAQRPKTAQQEVTRPAPH